MDARSLWEKFNDMLASDNDKDLAQFIAVMFIVITLVCTIIGLIYM